MEIISCLNAKAKGLTRYFTGKPCPHNHICERYVAGRGCLECSASHRDNYYERTKHLPKQKELQKNRSRKWYENNPEKSFEAHYKWAARNKDKVNALSVKYYTDKMQRLPLWADLEAIEKVYTDCHKLCQETGLEYHVDHVIPLRGKNISGLHVENNLQILSGKDNRSKGNKLLTT